MWRKTWTQGDETLESVLHLRESVHVSRLTEVVGWGNQDGETYFVRGQLGDGRALRFVKRHITGCAKGCEFAYEGFLDDDTFEVTGRKDEVIPFTMWPVQSSSADEAVVPIRTGGWLCVYAEGDQERSMTVHITAPLADATSFEGTTSDGFLIQGQAHGHYIRFEKALNSSNPAGRRHSQSFYEGVFEGGCATTVIGRWSTTGAEDGKPPVGWPWRDFHGNVDSGQFQMKQIV